MNESFVVECEDQHDLLQTLNFIVPKATCKQLAGGRKTILIEAVGSNWQGETGYALANTLGRLSHLLLDGSHFSSCTVCVEENREIHFVCSGHDVPMGSSVRALVAPTFRVEGLGYNAVQAFFEASVAELFFRAPARLPLKAMRGILREKPRMVESTHAE